ncbi:DNA translocase FtsK [Candidatus Phycorickettsia trachydisci]|uniref:DNA translocase FtsK n=1 Tax=Candidatus Phycorickettsia trachydisci TaxID=2115978 RepID=UPI0039772BAC
MLYIPRSERFATIRKELPKETKISKIYQAEKKGPPKAFKKRTDQDFQLPDLNLLHEHDTQNHKQETKAQIEQNAADLLKTLGDFGVKGKIISISQGPVVTLYEFEPAAGTKSSRVIGLAGDIARSLSAVSARISTIAGRNALGIELPNTNRQFFGIKELIQTTEYNDHKNTLPIILGKDIGGKPFVVDLAKMPHLLIAGTTGSGKSVGINTMIMSLLYRYTPDECKLIMIDPKMLELSVYDDIPHLLTPVVTESSKAVQALKWAVREMEQRYRLMSQIGVRNITNYNQRVLDAINKGENSNDYRELVSEGGKYLPEGKLKTMPFVVIIVDEMADLMLVSGKEIESYIQRLAQMARAAGLHLITATQRPSVDVITGVIKANFPSRISFKVTSKIDSRTILGEMGAEQLLGMGDMLYMGNGSKITRVHGPFVGDREVEDVVEFLKSQGTPEYVSAVTALDEESEADMFFEGDGGDDDKLYAQAIQIVKRDRKCSTSYIQRCLRIGYNRAAILVERMEKEGIISEPNHSGKREIFME